MTDQFLENSLVDQPSHNTTDAQDQPQVEKNAEEEVLEISKPKPDIDNTPLLYRVNKIEEERYYGKIM